MSVFCRLAASARGICFVGEDKFGKRFDDLNGFEANGDDLADEAKDVFAVVGAVSVVGIPVV